MGATTISCPGCRKVLKVPEGVAGRQAMCPQCRTVFNIPQAVSAPPASAQAPPASAQAAPAERHPAASPHALGAGPASRRSCPKCGAAMSADAVICVACGLDMRGGSNLRQLQTAVTTPPQGGPLPAKQPAPAKKHDGFFGAEKRGIDKGVVGGLAMMGIAVVWFVGGLAFDIIFYYPPILFVIGLFAFFKGLITGNIAGKKDKGQGPAG